MLACLNVLLIAIVVGKRPKEVLSRSTMGPGGEAQDLRMARSEVEIQLLQCIVQLARIGEKRFSCQLVLILLHYLEWVSMRHGGCVRPAPPPRELGHRVQEETTRRLEVLGWHIMMQGAPCPTEPLIWSPK